MASSMLARLLVGGRLSGPALPAAAALLSAPALGRGIYRLVTGELGVPALRGLPSSARGEIPLEARPLQARPPRRPPPGKGHKAAPSAAPWPRGAAALVAAYQGGASPEAALRRVLEGSAALGPRTPLVAAAPGAAEAAAAAAARHREGRPLSPLDGVPVLIKEEAAIAGLPLRLGARFTDDLPAPQDATAVARLRAAGAVIAGQSKMTEYGLSPLGVSAQQLLPANPHSAGHSAGGSSTGAAAAVALGLSPVGLGGDGGGSIRIPSALCGVFGLKPTFGRVPRTGDPFGGTLDHLGPLGATVADLAAFLSICCGPDGHDPASAWAPPDTEAERAALLAAPDRGVRSLRIGVSDALFAASDADVAHACARALDVLVALGAERVKVDLPLCGHASAIGYLTFGGELLCMLREVMERRPGDIGADLLMSLRLLSHIPGDGYLDAQRLRAGLREELRGAFSSVDLLAMPTTGQAAPPLSEVERAGLIDLPSLDALVRFTFIGNLSGLPALSAPVGVKASGGAELPVGLQLVGDAWDEATVLAAAGALERQGAAEVRRPPGAIDLLA